MMILLPLTWSTLFSPSNIHLQTEMWNSISYRKPKNTPFKESNAFYKPRNAPCKLIYSTPWKSFCILIKNLLGTTKGRLSQAIIIHREKEWCRQSKLSDLIFSVAAPCTGGGKAFSPIDITWTRKKAQLKEKVHLNNIFQERVSAGGSSLGSQEEQSSIIIHQAYPKRWQHCQHTAFYVCISMSFSILKATYNYSCPHPPN